MVIAVPKELLSLVHLDVGSKVEVNVSNGKLVVQAVAKPRYELRDLLARCKPGALRLTAEDREWLESPPVGKEV